MTEEEFKALKPGDMICATGHPLDPFEVTGPYLYGVVGTEHGEITVPRYWDLVTKAPDMDQVNHPTHYKSGPIEVIHVIEAFDLGFHLGNVVKYILRAGKKGGPEKLIEDLKKARWYLDRHISNLEKGDGK